MPELPEVEIIKNDLLEKVVDSTITKVSYTTEGQNLISKTDQDLTNILTGRKIIGVERKAKYLVLTLSENEKLVFHLKLTGRILVRDASYRADEFTRLILRLGDEREIRFTDRNGFGEVRLIGEKEDINPNLAPDPFELSFQQFKISLGKTLLKTIKEALLDQSLIAGVGNIYADEALYVAGINPFRSPLALSDDSAKKLLDSIRVVLNEGIKHRGTTIDSYRDTEGRPGTHQFHLKVYGKAGKPCQKCATRIEYTEIKGRRTHFCPNCQPKDQLSLF